MRPTSVTISMEAADRNGIALAQTLGGAGNLTLAGALASGGVATLDVPRKVSVYSAGNISTVVFTITGTNRYGQTISDTVTGVNNSTVLTDLDFATVTQVAADAAVGTNVEVGSGDSASSAWIPVSSYGTGVKCGLFVRLSSGASLTYNIEHTEENPFEIRKGNIAEDASVFTHDTMSSETTSQDGNYAFPPFATRITVTGYTSGSAKFTVIQSGM